MGANAAAQSRAPEEPQSNVITFHTPPSQRINDFDPTASALWPTWVALCSLSRNSLAGGVQSTAGRGRRRRRRGQMKVTALEVNLDLKSQQDSKIPQGKRYRSDLSHLAQILYQ